MPVFDANSVTKAVHAALPDLEPGEKVLIGTVDDEGAKIMIAAKVLDTNGAHDLRLDVRAVAAHDWDGDDSLGAQVIMRWR